MYIVAIFGINYVNNNLKTNLTSFYISLTGDTVKFLFRFKWLVKRGLGRPLFLLLFFLA
jgi:hypothetical protein